MSLIFIVDDSTLSLNALSHLLESEGHKAICLKESTDAADMISEARPDLLLLDVVMPKLGGLELLGELKARPGMDMMPVIMVTAKTDAEDVRAALDAGAFDYIRKPFEAIEVLARVRSALRTRHYMERLVYLSEHDGLTRLLNHSTILRELGRSLEALSTPGCGLTVVMCDIDYFKRINDGYGHQAGDAVLIALGKLLIDAQGATGIAGRYGGEEFCIILGGFDRAMALRWAETFRAVVEAREWEADGRRLRFTMSFGLAWTESGEGRNSGEILAEADRRLYLAKGAGRNRVVAADQDPVTAT
jgi:two-component system, cell cycle response regulator